MLASQDETIEVVKTPLQGVWELFAPSFRDHRGEFVNAFRLHNPAFASLWAPRGIAQINFSRTERIGTIRGLHLQEGPHTEARIIRCLRGRVWDVAVDLRPASGSFGRWHGVELSPERSNAYLIPEGCAHGFQVLESGSELLYVHSGRWVPEFEGGVRWDDPQLAVAWPLPAANMSERDAGLPTLAER
jgi:dTDP-4-dehydrorhamnose 3,5-epimerase